IYIWGFLIIMSHDHDHFFSTFDKIFIIAKHDRSKKNNQITKK
ncbi:hypothetical protein LCGC14_0266770, partial [marine sediment metagenome]